MDMISLPYNFVPLNDELVIDAEELPNRRYFNTERKSGVISCKVTTLSPIYIAGDKKGEFFHHGDPNNPVIPGSSLRGMIRSIVQVITWSKLQPVTDKEMYLRDVDNDDDYMKWMKDKVQAAFICKDSRGLYLETCDLFKVHHNLMLECVPELDKKIKDAGRLFIEKNRNKRQMGTQVTAITEWLEGEPDALSDELKEDLQVESFKQFYFTKGGYPNWKYQNKPVWIQLNDKGYVVDFQINEPTDATSWKEGILVITGWIDTKEHEYVFVRRAGAEELKDTDITKLIQQLEDDDQISDWQKRAFPTDQPKDQSKDKPKQNTRRKPGAVRVGEPVFYVKDGEKVKFLGRAYMFRLHYGKSPHNLLPKIHQSNTQIDMTEAIFGFVEKDLVGKPAKSYAYKGRVSFSDSVYQDDGSSPWLREEAFAPRILASPKPASYTTYLEQPTVLTRNETEHEKVQQLIKYSTPNAKLRGQKFYWHQVKLEGEGVKPLGYDEIKQPPNNRNFEQTMKPVKDGKSFKFTIHFEDLSNVELGALLWALLLPGTEHLSSAHKLGMGKSIGMGSVRVELEKLQILTHADRYKSLDAEGYNLDDPEKYMQKFISYMNESIDPKFEEHPRIRHLRMILCEPGVDWKSVGYWDNKGFKAYEKKPILKSVEAVYSEACVRRKDQEKERPAVSAELGMDAYIGRLIRGVVGEPSDDGTIIFDIDNPEPIKGNYGLVPPDKQLGKKYNPNFRIKAMVTKVIPEDDGYIFECTLDFPKDLK